MATARKLNVSALQGMQLHDGFLGEETLSRLIQLDSYKSVSQLLINDKLRSFRDTYREFSRNIDRLQGKKNSTKINDLLIEWTASIVNYLGYRDFEERTLNHWDDGKITYLAPKTESHSVNVFFCTSTDALNLNIYDNIQLTSIDGTTLSNSSRKESLCEQIEKAINIVGAAEGILITPNAVYYFRADSQVSGQCLECRWNEMLLADNDQALALATYLFRADFFSFSNSIGEDEKIDEDTLAEESEEEEDASGGVSAKLTQSNELFRENIDQAREITEDLHKQVVLALEILINERISVDTDLKKEALKQASNERIANDLFKDGLFVLYRILFVLYAEARDFLPVDNRRFSSFYSLEHLRNWSEDFLRMNSRGLGNPEGTYIWGALNSIFTLLRRGVRLPGDQLVSPYNGQLFAPDRSPYFDQGPALRDEAMARVITSLTRVGGEESARRLYFANLGVEQLGAVYEALLAQKPTIVREKTIWVPAHGGGVGLVSEKMADALEMDLFEQSTISKNGRSKKMSGESLEKSIDLRRPAFIPSIGKFIVAPLGGQKRQTASFYTPPKLAEFLVRRTLKPLVEAKSSRQILGLRIVEPAMGSGGFLIQVIRYLATHLLKARIAEGSIELRSGNKADSRDLQRCKREVVESCIFGTDINPLAIELARTSLYLEALVPGEPLPFLHHRLKAGNSLIGADFQNRSRSQWKEGTYFPMLFDIPIEHIKIDEKLWKIWNARDGKSNVSDHLKEAFDSTKKRAKAEKRQIGDEAWGAWANEMQLQVNEMLQMSKQAQEDFEKKQVSNEVIDHLEDRYRDHLELIPDMDPVLIEAYGVPIDDGLLEKRKRALLQENGIKIYNALVARQRAYMRLKALGDLHVGLWYWPLDSFHAYPSFAQYKAIISWLLNLKTLSPKAPAVSLDKSLLRVLKLALKSSREQGALHWQVEFASVFADPTRQGFDAIISNPPWKAMGLVDKDFYPQFDPQFSDTAPSKKEKRINKLGEINPSIPKLYFTQAFAQNRIGEHWRSGALSDIAPKGQLDYCTGFSLLPSRLLRNGGRSGLIVSRPAIFVSKNTVAVREYFFRQGGLKEAMNFHNRCLIFDIAPHMEFSLIINEIHSAAPNTISSPKFLSGLADPNILNAVDHILDNPKSAIKIPGCFPVVLSEKDIRACFSPKNLVVPQLRHQKEIDIAKALVTASGPIIRLDKIKGLLKRGIDHSSGPSNAVYKFSEDLSEEARPRIKDILESDNSEWIPLCRGRDFNLFDSLVDVVGTKGDFNVSEYVKHASVGDYFDLSKATLVWRATGGKCTNKRSPVCTLLPPGLWFDHNVWGFQPETLDESLALLCLFGSLALDFYTGLISYSNVSKGVALTLPIPLYGSTALDKARDIAKGLLAKVQSDAPYWKPISNTKPIIETSHRESAQAKIDALIWIHFGLNKSALDRVNLEWILNNHFPILNNTNPNYKRLVLEAFDEYVTNTKVLTLKTKPVFTQIAEVLDLDSKRAQEDVSETSIERRQKDRRLSERRRG